MKTYVVVAGLLIVMVLAATQPVEAYACKSSSAFWWWVDFLLPGDGWGVWWHDEGAYGRGCHVPVGEGFG